MYLCLISLLLITSAFASLEKLTIKNLDLQYALPHGKGVVDKVLIGLKGMDDGPYPVEINRTSSSFEIISPLVELTWLDPQKFFLNLGAIQTEKLNLSVGKFEHNLDAHHLSFQPEKKGFFDFQEIALACSGHSTQLDLGQRLMEDCQNKLTASVKKLELPLDSILVQMTSELPKVLMDDVPGSDLTINIDQGQFNLGIRVKYYITARLTAFGQVAVEEQTKTLVIKIDKIKYGILPITNWAMGQIARRVQNPSIEIKPPYIRIKLGTVK
jgi:hypothetical protein